MSQQQEPPSKLAVSVAEMARMVSLSRARFYQLQKAGVFPPPEYDRETLRPFYGEEQQRACLEVRRRNCGINGKAVLFYAPRNQMLTPRPRQRPTRAAEHRSMSQPKHTALVSSLAALGMTATVAQVASALASLFPGGIAGTDEPEVIRQVFLHIRRQNSADNVGR